MLDFGVVNTENGIRKLIAKNLRKEIHPATKPSIDFIKDILDKAYASGITYDVTDIRQAVSNFAMGSTNNAELCTKLVSQMHFKSKEDRENSDYGSDELVFFDVEVFPNLLLVNWKYRGKDKNIVRLINPSGKDLEPLFKMKLIGFNCRRYDNHILYARYIGYSLEQIYALSKAIISENRNVFFGEAYNLSYADVYDFSSIKQSLKKFQIDLGIHHKELGIPWDKPVPEEDWWRVSEYCDNDVLSLEAVFDSRKEDFVARQILSDLSGLPVNDTTQQHTAKIIFGNDRNPQEHFVYTDLSTLFPGYTFEGGKSFYRGEDPGEGGHVFSIPGVYENVALLDVVSMYPTNIELLNLFGKYTKNYSQLKEARVLIKHGDYEAASKIMDGAFAKYLKNKEEGSALAYALKIVINIVYGLTSAKFPNKFRDPRNVDNIVAKRGSLFMIELKHACRDKGMMLFHIKTDSVKIANATQEDIDFVVEFGKKYGYTFELEGRYSKLCLINDAVYIARYSEGKNAGKWTATGTEFAIPYVFKRLFSGEEILFEDKCEAKSVTTHMVLDMNENLPEGEHNYVFVGRVGLFCPIKKGRNGGLLLREKDGKYYAVTGTKGQRWLEAETVRSLRKEDDIDLAYYETLVKSSREDIERYVDFDLFVSDKPFPLPF